MRRPRRTVRGALAVVVLGVVAGVVVVATGGADHSRHAGTGAVAGATTTTIERTPDRTAPSSPAALRVGLAAVLVGGWAVAFTAGIRRRSVATGTERPDYDKVSDTG